MSISLLQVRSQRQFIAQQQVMRIQFLKIVAVEQAENKVNTLTNPLRAG